MDINEFYKQFGALVKQYRWERLKMTQKDLADKIGLSRASIANIESGNQRILLHQLYLLAENLQIDVRELLPEQKAATETLDFKERMPKNTSKEVKGWIDNIMRRAQNEPASESEKKRKRISEKSNS